MSALTAPMLQVLQAVINKTVKNTEDTVNQIQAQVLEITNLSEFQRNAIENVRGEAEKITSGNMVERLQELMKSNSELADVLMPIIVSLQFQDRLRQELESLLKAFTRFTEEASKDDPALAENPEPFWIEVAKGFTNIESREVVLKAAMGSDYQVNEADVRDASVASSDDFFL